MKKLACVLALLPLVSCLKESSAEEAIFAAERAKPCVDSTDLEWFDELGVPHISRISCDSMAVLNSVY